MALDCRSTRTEAFLELQEKVMSNIYLAGNSLVSFKELLATHNLGGKFHLVSILDQLSKLGLDIINEDSNNKKVVRSTFFGRLLPYAMNHSLREVKFKARIPVPESYQLVGVADEGQAYINEGKENVYTLKEGHIYGTSPCSCAVIYLIHKTIPSLRPRIS
jgi:RNA-dependent RNA polymerase